MLRGANNRKSPPQLERKEQKRRKTIALAKNPEFHRRTKHTDVRFHWIRDAAERNRIDIEYVSTKDKAADGFTKPLPLQGFLAFLTMIGMKDVRFK